MNKKELSLKTVFLGPSSVGKTSLINRYVHNTYRPGTQATIGAGFLSHVLNENPLSKNDSTVVTLILWDTAGEERFKSVAPCLLHGSEGLILVFSLTEHETFEAIDDYYTMFIDVVPMEGLSELPILLIGNKCDLCEGEENERQVTQQEIDQWMERNNITMYAEVSAKTGKGIKEAIENKLVKSILASYKSQQADIVSLTPQEKPPEHKKGCC